MFKRVEKGTKVPKPSNNTNPFTYFGGNMVNVGLPGEI